MASPRSPRPHPQPRTWLLIALALVLAACGGGGGGEGPRGQAQADDGGAPAPAPLPDVAGLLREIQDLVATPGSGAGTIQLAFTAPTGSPLDRYEVRRAIVPIDPDAPTDTTLVAGSFPAGPAGRRETLTVTGLQAGQHHQFIVRAIRADGTSTLWSHCAEARAPGALRPPPPANAIAIQAAGALRTNGGYYLLTRDLVVSGSGYTIEGRGITLDLGGHTLTYAAGGGDGHHGVSLDGFSGSGSVRIVGGRIVQGAGGGRACHAVDLSGGHDVQVSDLYIEVSGPDAMGIAQWSAPTGSLRIDHCHVVCNTESVSNRHWPGVGAIWLDRVTGSLEIDHNRIEGSPQWGIRAAGPRTDGTCRIHHNLIRGTKALVANGYMLGIHKPDAEVFENDCRGESRGLHMDGVDGHGFRARVRFNAFDAQDQPNAEYPEHWCHGAKFEEAQGARFHNNFVRVIADAQHAEGNALDLDLASTADEVIVQNRIESLARDGTFLSRAVNWTGGSSAANPTFTLRHNAFVATDIHVHRDWHSGTGQLFRENAWLVDPARPQGFAPVFERFDNQDGRESHGHGFVDPITTRDPDLVSTWSDPGPSTSTRYRTCTFAVTRDGAPQANASVTVRDRTGAQVATTTSDGAGIARVVIATKIVHGGSEVDVRGPFAVTVSRTGVGSWSGSVRPDARASFHIDLGTGQGTQDVSPPPAPEAVLAIPVSSGRLVVRWVPGEDASGIALYEVWMDGGLYALSPIPETILGGLQAGTSHTIQVRARDAGGNVSPLTLPVTVRMPAESRGP